MELEQELDFFKREVIESKKQNLDAINNAVANHKVIVPNYETGWALKIEKKTKLHPALLWIMLTSLSFVITCIIGIIWIHSSPSIASLGFTILTFVIELVFGYFGVDFIQYVYDIDKEDEKNMEKFSPLIKELNPVLEMLSNRLNTIFTYKIKDSKLEVYEVYDGVNYINSTFAHENTDIHTIAEQLKNGHIKVLEERFASILYNELEQIKRLDFELYFEISKNYKGEQLLSEFKRLKGLK